MKEVMPDLFYAYNVKNLQRPEMLVKKIGNSCGVGVHQIPSGMEISGGGWV